MATKRKNTSSTSGGGRSSTAASSRRARKKSGPVRVWSEASITVAITDDPPQFAKFSHGFEKMAPNDTDAALKRTEEEIFRSCEQVIEKRAKKLARLIRQINNEEL